MRRAYRIRIAAIALMVMGLLGMVGGASVSAQDAMAFTDLVPGQRVYDTTGESLTPEETADLTSRLDAMAANGTDVIVYVRALDATPEETLDQVEALQQAWVATTGANQDTAVAILINRNPQDAEDARAGIFVGKTYDDGNVPRGEQEAIVDDELIPPLRDGDVYGSFRDGLSRLETSIANGPPKNAFERWSADVGEGWLPWLGVVLAVPGALVSWAAFGHRQTTARSEMPATSDRPGNLDPAIASALAMGGPQASAIPATLLSLAERGALVIEPEREGSTFSQPKVRVRLLDDSLATSAIDRTLWRALEDEARDDVVESKDLQQISAKTTLLNGPVEEALRQEGWLDDKAPGKRTQLTLIGLGAIILAIFGFVVAGVGSAWSMLVPAIVLLLVGAAALVMAVIYSPFTSRGQEAALPWKAYREGLKRAAKDRTIAFDLDRVFVDVIAMNLGHDFDRRLKDAAEEGVVLRAFRDQQGQPVMMGGSSFPYWIAYSATMTSSSGTGTTSTVSSGGAGGGGGAAGST